MRPRLLVEALDPRILYTADAAALLGLDGAPGVADVRDHAPVAPLAAAPAAPTAQAPSSMDQRNDPSSREIVFIDSRVPDAMALADELMRQRGNGHGFEIVVLDAAEDGVAQIDRALAGEHGLAAIHLISHGSDGAIHIGSTQLDASRLASDAAAVARWGQALGVGGDLLLYGCNVAGSASGRLFVHDLAQLTGADVAASTDTTGSAALGGNWTLEFATGRVHTTLSTERFDALQWQGTLATFFVTNTNDSGAGSLRDAITFANTNPGADTINFAIIGTGVHTITLATVLPTITGAVTIDATTDDSFAANGNRPAIVLNGNNAVADGLRLYTGSDGSTIRGLVIQRFTQDGIDIASSNGNTIAGNWIGLNAAGTGAAGNQQGVNLWNANNNLIGGSTAADRNVISASSGVGVNITTDNGTSNGNLVRGNYIGTDASGTVALGNANQGIYINTPNNTVGGTLAGQGNVVAGTLNWAGVTLDVNASGTLVAGNLIGLNAAGTAALGNHADGLDVYSANNTIGGVSGAARNVISGNAGVGIQFNGAGATGNVVTGNYIGTDISGTLDVDGNAQVNGASGISLTNGANNNRIGTNADGSNDAQERNVISGNNWVGVDIVGSGTSNNLLYGNYIGTDVSGLVALGNSLTGVSFWNGSSGNHLGSGLAGAGNVISANQYGVHMGAGVTGNEVQGNLIGLGADGLTALGNTSAGVWVRSGGLAALVTGNVIGTNADGSNDAGERNVISANNMGVLLEDAEVTGNRIAGNFIGTDVSGMLARGNVNEGVRLDNGANANTIGGGSAGQRNVVAGNGNTGILIVDETSDNNVVRGNSIGVNAAGNAALGNGNGGIAVVNGADNTVIGGSGAGEGNWIAGSAGIGIEIGGAASGTVIQGNRIGTDLAGTANWGQQEEGIWLHGGVTGTLVGGTSAAAANIIAFNGQGGFFDDGISVQDASSTGNVFLRNAIYGNLGQGIDLGLDGVTPNDAGDVDTGSNNLLNTLVLSGASTTGSVLRVDGSYSGAPNTFYRIEVYGNPTAEPSGTGEGRTFLGSVNMPIGASGTLTGSYSFTAAVAAGTYISTTVTRTDASYTTFYDTSEFSNHVVAGVVGISVTPTSGGVVSEAGSTAQFSVVLDGAPTANVTIALTSSDTSEGTLSTASLTFTPANWNVAQTVTVTGVNDMLADGNIGFSVVTGAAVSADAAYNGLDASDVLLTTTDDDVRNTIVVDTAADTIDGNTSSLDALLANRGADGRISLREAITAANNTANGAGGADQIFFAIAGTGEHVINVGTALPTITDALVIDASTDDSFAANGNRPAIVLDGNNTAGSGLTLGASADGSTVRGLVIRDFGGSGILILPGSDNHLIVGNYLGRLTSAGTDAGATEANGGNGIQVQGTGNTIGGNAAADANVLSGSVFNGIEIGGAAALNNRVLGNTIGLTADGTAALGNGAAGIVVFDPASSGNSLLGNRIAANGGLGIDLGTGGVDANDTGDADAGANNGQNFPVLTQASVTATQITLAGSLNSTANDHFRIELFASVTGDASGHGEGQVFLGFVNVATDGSGNATFSTTLTVAVPAGSVISATATRSDAAYTSFTDTSEFAANISAAPLSPPVNTVPAAQATNEDTVRVFSVANGNAITVADADAGGADNQVTISVSNGTLTLAGTAGLSFSAGDGTADPTMTLRGSASAINTALNGLRFDPVADYNGGAVLTLTTTDAVLLSLDIDTGLLGHYGFDSPAALGADSSPATAHPGTVNGATAVADATRGAVLGLDGNSSVQIAGRFGDPANVTIAAWVNLSVADVNGAEVISLGDSVLLRLDAGGQLTGGYYNGSTWVGTSVPTLLAGTGWHHVAFSFDDNGNRATLYLDGAAVAQTLTTDSINYTLGANSVIGSHGNGGSGFDFTGRIDDARIYSHVLSAAEIATLAQDQVMTARDTVAITVAAVNDVPVNTGPATLTVSEDTAVAITGLAITDPDAGSSVLRTELSVTSGTLAATSGGAVTVTGSGTGTLVLIGTLADLNAYLASSAAPTFTGAANANGVATLTMVTSDGLNTGTGGVVAAGQFDYRFQDGTPAGSNPDNVSASGGVTGIATDLSVSALATSLSGSATSFGIIYTGVMNVVTAGSYTFTLNADDAANLYIDGNFVLLAWFGSASNSVVLSSGQHSVEMRYAQDVGGAGFSASYAGPDTAAAVVPLLSSPAVGRLVSPTATTAITITPVNDAPVITSDGGGASATRNVAENTSAVTTVTATDVDAATTLTYTIIGGADAAKFAINASTGVLTFVTAPDFEVPTDAGGNHVYDVTVQVSDGSLAATQAIAVTVTAVNDNAPAITSGGGGAAASVNVAENGAAVITVTATDADLPGQTLSYAISGGADAALFSINSATGALTFVTAPDYEAPADAGANNVYDVTVQVSDGALTDTQAIAVTVTDVSSALVVTTAADTNDTGLGASFTAEQLNANRGSDGAVSLREAIIAANNTPGADTIGFNIAGTGVHSIDVLSALPVVTDTLVIDGRTDDSYAANGNRPAIVIDGHGLAADGLVLAGSANGSALRGLVVQNFAGNGVTVLGSGNTLLDNQFNGHGGLGIDLGNDGVTPNDNGDVDSGANGLQNFPVLTSAYSFGGSTTLVGTFDSSPGASYRIEFFSSPVGSSSGHGEGQRVLGFVDLTTDGGGHAAFTVVLNGVSVAAGQSVSATATQDLGGGLYGSTSEFAANAVAVANSAPRLTLPAAPQVNEDTPLAITGLAIADDESNLSALQLSVGQGRLQVDLAGGASISMGANGSATLTLSGTQAQISAALASLAYQGGANFNGSDSLSLIATDAAGLSDSGSLTITVNAVNDAPTGLPTLSGNAVAGQSLSALTTGLADADGLGAVGYQWLRDGVVIGGATGSSYSVDAGDVGTQLSVRVSYTDAQGTAESLVSGPSAIVVAAAPVVVPPVVVPVVPPLSPVVDETAVPQSPAPDAPPTGTPGPEAAPAPTSASPIAGAPRSATDSAAPAVAPREPSPALSVETPGVEVLPGRPEAAGTPMSAAVPARAVPVANTRPNINADYLDVQARAVGEDGLIGSLAIQDPALFNAAQVRSGMPARHEGADPRVLPPDADDAPVNLSLAGAASATGLALTAGTVWWALRAGGLLTSLVVSMPAWRHADLLAVLPDDEDDEDGWDPTDDEQAARDEEAVGQVLDARFDGGAR